MAIIIPFLVFFLIFLISYIKLGGDDASPVWRMSYLSASIVWGTLVVLITEILSILSLLTFDWLLGFWVGTGLISVFFCIFLIIKNKPSIHFAIPKIPRSEIPLLVGIVSIVMTLCLLALLSPPNTWDSMVYHMSRVSHWIQNRNLAHYPTHVLRQLYLQPMAEFIILHFQILSGGDQFANLVQWFSMIGSLIGVSLLAREMGANLTGQIFAALLCSTIPMGILQGASTQNDYVVTFWLICFVYSLMLLRTQFKLVYSLAAGASLGLAILTKATGYIFAFPFILWFIFSGLKRHKWKLWKPILVIAIIALVINLGYFVRNFELYGHPLAGSEDFKDLTNNAMSVPLLISNIARNIGLHLGTPEPLINGTTAKAIKFLHSILGVSTNDPRITVGGHDFAIYYSTREDIVGNFFHFVLITVSILIFFITSQRKKAPDLMNYCLTLVGGFLLFALYLKWQPWHSRLHLPLFVFWSPFVAMVLSRMEKPNRILLIFIGMMFLYFGLKIGEVMSKGEVIGFINKIIGGQAAHSLRHYLMMENNMFVIINICFLLLLFFLYFRAGWKTANAITLILILTSLPWFFPNYSKSLIGKENVFNTRRIDQYFVFEPELKDPNIGAIDYIRSKGCSDIGIILDDYVWEYQFFVLLKESGTQKFRIEHVNVNNISSVKYRTPPFNMFNPCAIISVTSAEQGDKISVKDAVYVKEWSSYPVNVFVRK